MVFVASCLLLCCLCIGQGKQRQYTVIRAIERCDNPVKKSCLHAIGFLVIPVSQSRPTMCVSPMQELCPVVAPLAPAQAHGLVYYDRRASAERTVSVATASIGWQRL